MTMAMQPSLETGLIMEQNPCQYMEVYNDTARRIAVRFSYVSESIIQPTIFSVGILTNALSLLVLKGVRMNKVFRTCLLALALSDFCTTIVGLTQILVEIFFYCGQVPEGYLLAPVVANNTLYMLFLYFVSSSAGLVVFIAFIRNIMYLKPLKARAYFTPKITRTLCGLIFFVTFIIYTPTSLLVLWLGCFKETGNAYCTQLNARIPNLKSIANGYIYFISAIYGPFMFLVYIANFICIRVSLRRSAATVTRMMIAQGQEQQHKRNDTVTRITKTLSVILILDVICTVPSLIQSIGVLLEPEDTHEKNNLFFEVIDVVAEIFLALRPTYNFWIYVFQRPEFRTRLLYLLHKTFYPCCGHDCCPCRGLFSEDKLKKQSMQMTTSSGNGSKRNVNETATHSTALMNCTPPLSTPPRKLSNNNSTASASMVSTATL